MGSVSSPGEKKGKGRQRKEKKKQHCSTSITFFPFFLFYSFTLKGPFVVFFYKKNFNLRIFGIIILNVFVVTNFIIFCNKILGKALISFSSVNWTNFAVLLETNCQFFYITNLKKKNKWL
jgi:hypothetical protein